jgi:hypothetical protein
MIKARAKGEISTGMMIVEVNLLPFNVDVFLSPGSFARTSGIVGNVLTKLAFFVAFFVSPNWQLEPASQPASQTDRPAYVRCLFPLPSPDQANSSL